MADDLAGLLEGLAPIRVEGRFWRHSIPRYPVLAGSPAGGRPSPPGLPALYLARPRECCVAEAYRSLVDGREGMRPELVGPRRLATVRVAVSRVLDLRAPESATTLGLSGSDLHGPHDRCGRVGAAAAALGLRGVLAPSASALGEVLALCPANLPRTERPWITYRRIWRGLPAEPAGRRPSG